MAPQFTLTALQGIPYIRQGDDLAQIILASLERERLTLNDGDVLVIAQKIISKSEGRTVRLSDVTPSPQALELAAQSGKDPRLCEVILWDTREIMRVRPGLIIVETVHGWVCANAGLDRSNVAPHEEGWVLRLPADADRSANALRERLHALTEHWVGIVINDTHGRPWRDGAVGVAIGVAGMPALQDLRGHPDLFGYEFQSTVVGYADQLASAASLLQGQADEGQPVVLVRGLLSDAPAGTARQIVRAEDLNLFR